MKKYEDGSGFGEERYGLHAAAGMASTVYTEFARFGIPNLVGSVYRT